MIQYIIVIYVRLFLPNSIYYILIYVLAVNTATVINIIFKKFNLFVLFVDVNKV